MSSSIRPPSSGSPGAAHQSGLGEPTRLGDASRLDQAGEVSGASQAGSAQSAREAGAAAAAQAQGTTGSWLAKLDAKEISRSEAIEGLVAQALEAHGGATLLPAQRAELEGILRDALLEDPVLGRLLGGS